MGEGKRKARKFKEQHPFCCFCGGERETETRDHVPPRAAFFGKIWPEGFEFPACASCNAGTRLHDQYFSWHLRTFGWPPDWVELDERNTLALGQGIRNNQPDLLPISQNRLQEIAWLTENRLLGTPYRGVQIRQQAIVALEATYRKLAVALFYKHVGRPLPAAAGVGSKIKLNVILQTEEMLSQIMRTMRFPAVPKRGPDDFMGQFIYTHDYNSEQGLFGISAKFGASVIGMAVCAERPDELTLEEVLPVHALDGRLLKAQLEV